MTTRRPSVLVSALVLVLLVGGCITSTARLPSTTPQPPTLRPTQTVAPTLDPLPLRIPWSEANDNGNILRYVTVDAGSYVLRWTLGRELHAIEGVHGCSVGVRLADLAGEYMGPTLDTEYPDLLPSGSEGELDYDLPTADTYSIFASSICELTMTLARSGTLPPLVVLHESLPLQVSGAASPFGQPTEQEVELAGGDYRLQYRVSGPFDSSGKCGVTMSLYDSSGAEAGGDPGISRVLTKTGTGFKVYRALEAGIYQVFAYVGCPWELELVRD